MRIPSNPSGPNLSPPDGPAEPRGTGGKCGAAEHSFEARRPGEAFAQASQSQRATIPADWRRAQLDDPEERRKLVRDSIGQLLASSPIARSFDTRQLLELESHLSGDPVVRELLTKHLEQGLD